MRPMPTTMCSGVDARHHEVDREEELLLRGLRQRRVEVRAGHQVVLELLGVLEVLDDEEDACRR